MFLPRCLAAVLALGLAGCARGADGPQLARDAAAAMGGLDRLRGIQSLTMTGGSGPRWQCGQAVRASDPDEPGLLRHAVDTIDFANGRAALGYEIVLPDGFTQHRTEVLTKKGDSLVGLEYVPGRPVTAVSADGLFGWASQDSPQALLRRNVVTVLLQAADAAASDRPLDRELDGRPQRFVLVTLRSGERVGLYFDAATRLLTAFEVSDADKTLGDVEARYQLTDYRTIEGVTLPHKITLRKNGKPYSEVQYASASIDDPGASERFAIPAEVAERVDQVIAAGAYSPVALSKVSDGVYLARAYSHNSLVVEFPSFLAVVEAPYSAAQSATLVRVLKDQFPSKPIRYAAVTHHHIDHTEGVRGLAAAGATIVTAEGHQPAIQRLLGAKHTLEPDLLETARKTQPGAGTIETFEYNHAIKDGPQTLELYAISGSPHADPIVIAYVPGVRVLFQSDLFTPGAPVRPASPGALHLLASVEELGLRVNTLAGGHGAVAPFADLEKAESLSLAAKKP